MQGAGAEAGAKAGAKVYSALDIRGSSSESRAYPECTTYTRGRVYAGRPGQFSQKTPTSRTNYPHRNSPSACFNKPNRGIWPKGGPMITTDCFQQPTDPRCVGGQKVGNEEHRKELNQRISKSILDRVPSRRRTVMISAVVWMPHPSQNKSKTNAVAVTSRPSGARK